MSHSIQIQIIAALVIIALLGLAAWAYRTAQKASAQGYDLGYDDAKRGHELRLNALQEEAASLARTVANQHTAHRLERDAIIQDADQRIATFACRAAACTSADLTTLTAAANQLGLARETYQRMQADDPARFAHKMQLLLINLAERMRTALEQPTTTHPDTELVEWLDQHATYWADNEETAELRFPINSNHAGYLHLRDALRDALTQQLEADAGDEGFGLVQAEDAA